MQVLAAVLKKEANKPAALISDWQDWVMAITNRLAHEPMGHSH